MGILKRKREERAEVTQEGVLLSSFLTGAETITRDQALQIPSVKSAINFVADTVSMLPIKLYQEHEGATEVVIDDPRIKLLNDDTQDTLDAVQFWRAIIADYYLGKGGYAYINRHRNKVKSLHYVDEEKISFIPGPNPIFKDYDILCYDTTYKPYDFLKILRNTKDGAEGKNLIQENSLIMNVVYSSLLFEEQLVKKGGNKKGFLKSAKKLTKDAMDALKDAWRQLYSNNAENVVILNDGMDFQEASNTSVEMQLNENKVVNATEISKLFNISESIIKGNATAKDYSNSFKIGVMPVLRAIESALNRDLLLEREKEIFYFAFDTKELLKGDTAERYKAYSEAVKAGWISKNEIRYIEDMPAIEGLDVVSFSLGEVIYDIENKVYFVPNTKSLQDSKMTNDDSLLKKLTRDGKEVN